MSTPEDKNIGEGEGNHEGDGGEKKLEGEGGDEKKQYEEGGENQEEEGGKEQEGEDQVDPLTSLLVLELECPVCLSPMVGSAPAYLPVATPALPATCNPSSLNLHLHMRLVSQVCQNCTNSHTNFCT